MLGQIVVREFGVSLRTLQDALDRQKKSPDKKLGDILVSLGALSSEQRDSALEIQSARRLMGG